MLDHHKKIKNNIIERLQLLAQVADDVGMHTLAQGIRTTRIPKLQNERFHLVILGEFNHGKSTFVNALLGSEVLPTGITPTTAAINHVVHSESAYASATMHDGTKESLSLGSLGDWVTAAGSRSRDVAFVEVGYPAELLRENITLVDTPGVNDLNESRADITYGYVPRADAVIFLLDAGQALKESEREFLSSHVLEGTRDRLIFVLGKVDLLSEAERDAVQEYVRGGLTKLVDEPKVFPLSARKWLAGEREDSGMNELLHFLGSFLDTDRAQILLDNAIADASRTGAYLQQNLGVKLNAVDLDLAELEQRIKHVREQLDASKRTLDELHIRIKAEAEAIKATVRLDLEQFTKKFIQALPAQIDAVEASDVKAFLPSFIEDKFREFAQEEGHKLAELLERLAEEVITITNENVEAASSTLANRIGPADTQVNIEVDSFKYDLGVYAVGALGTTVMLFVNTVAGGLLTLAAPVLSILLKSKVAGDIKEQAKERVPETVEKASEAMRPHFDQCVDDFAQRLRDFVIAAGNTLYKGISEILDQTIIERRQRGGEVEPLREATSEQIARVIEARSALSEVRSELWEAAKANQPPAPTIEVTSDGTIRDEGEGEGAASGSNGHSTSGLSDFANGSSPGAVEGDDEPDAE